MSVTPEVAKAIAVGLRDRMWEWHHALGFALAALLVVRIATAVVLRSERPVLTAARAVRDFRRAAAGERLGAAHVAMVKVGYVAFYLCVTFMVVTGSLLYFDVGGGAVKSAHEWMTWFFVLFGAGHIVGVLVAEATGSPGLVSDMLHGRD